MEYIDVNHSKFLKKDVYKSLYLFEKTWLKSILANRFICIKFYSFDGERNRKIPITNLSYKIAIPKDSKLIIDPNNWLLFDKERVN